LHEAGGSERRTEVGGARVNPTFERLRLELEGETRARGNAQHLALVGRRERREVHAAGEPPVGEQFPRLAAHDGIAASDEHIFLEARRVDGLTEVGHVGVNIALVRVTGRVQVNERTRQVVDALLKTRLLVAARCTLDPARRPVVCRSQPRLRAQA